MSPRQLRVLALSGGRHFLLLSALRRTILAGVVFAVLISPLDVSAADHCPDCLRAGAATIVVRVPAGAPMAGYGSRARRLAFPDVLALYPRAFWFKPNIGELDPIMTRALVLRKGSMEVVLVTVDVVAVDRDFTASVRARLARRTASDRTLVVAASHTHSGPGAFIDSRLMGFVAVDRLDHEVRDALVDAIAAAVQSAERRMRTARIGASSVVVRGLTVGRLARPVDPELVALKVVADTGTPIAVVWNFAIHGTVLGPRNWRLSGDVMGLASQLVEAEVGAPALFLNGAVADVSPYRHGHDGLVEASRQLATSITGAWHTADTTSRGRVEIRTQTVSLQAPSLSLRNCLGSWVPRRLAIPLGAAFPKDAELIGVDVGPVAWVAIPGELQSALGQRIKDSAQPRWPHVMVAGLTNDYLGYFVTAEDYGRTAYVTCANLYGPDAGAALTRAATNVLRELGAIQAGTLAKPER